MRGRAGPLRPSLAAGPGPAPLPAPQTRLAAGPLLSSSRGQSRGTRISEALVPDTEVCWERPEGGPLWVMSSAVLGPRTLQQGYRASSENCWRGPREEGGRMHEGGRTWWGEAEGGGGVGGGGRGGRWTGARGRRAPRGPRGLRSRPWACRRPQPGCWGVFRGRTFSGARSPQLCCCSGQTVAQEPVSWSPCLCHGGMGAAELSVGTQRWVWDLGQQLPGSRSGFRL